MRAYNVLESICNVREIKCWVFKKYLYDILVILVLYYVVKVSINNILKSTRKSLKMYKSTSLLSFFKSSHKQGIHALTLL